MSIQFIDKDGSFCLQNADETSDLYLPIVNEGGIMGSITPNLKGDSKLDQNSFLLEPVSVVNLHASTMGRNIWCRINNNHVWSAAGMSSFQMAEKYTDKKDRTKVLIGRLWQKAVRENEFYGIRSEVLSFSPATKEKVEIMQVTFENISRSRMELDVTVAIPIYGRSADNIRDHRHVTSLLHRIEVKEDGIAVMPALSFDERGHRVNELTYAVYARDENGSMPEGFYPILEDFIGEGGSLYCPKAVVTDEVEQIKGNAVLSGREAMGGICFSKRVLEPKCKCTYNVVLSYGGDGMQYLKSSQIAKAFDEMKEYWKQQSAAICETGDKNFDRFMNWVGIQPVLRRIYGCSFLPHHDYGRGGRGWRDLWQDSLALLLVEADSIREMLIGYYGGVRMDGSNATIIGPAPGEFIADRNSIVRLWMDHGFWPFLTTELYVNRSGDTCLLFEEAPYFKDKNAFRCEGEDDKWDGFCKVKTENDEIYMGSVLEHILVQHLTIFYDVGEHNHMKLRGADWNDALDMAKENGESAAFTAAYSGNFINLAKLLRSLRLKEGVDEILLAEELQTLLLQPEDVYDLPLAKQKILRDYCGTCVSSVSGRKFKMSVRNLESVLTSMGEWIQRHIRKTEWIGDQDGNQWFNGYYDNDKERVEGEFNSGVRMMLTSQVFTIMSGTATDEQVAIITKAVDQYLFDSEVGGYRLNTDFKELKSNLGRMFGFAYGHKENGAVFSHMTVMYAYSLYSRGFVKEGYQAVRALYEHMADFDKSCIYPGIPEYFNERGRGMYHYLTGSASWLILTVITEMFGIKGKGGELLLSPKLMAEQFDESGLAGITVSFAGRMLKVMYENKDRKEIGDYEIEEVYINDSLYPMYTEETKIERNALSSLQDGKEHMIRVVLN